MDVDDSDGSERRAMTPEEVLDELRDEVKDELEAARRESAIAEAEVCDLRQEIDRIQSESLEAKFLVKKQKLDYEREKATYQHEVHELQRYIQDNKVKIEELEAKVIVARKIQSEKEAEARDVLHRAETAEENGRFLKAQCERSKRESLSRVRKDFEERILHITNEHKEELANQEERHNEIVQKAVLENKKLYEGKIKDAKAALLHSQHEALIVGEKLKAAEARIVQLESALETKNSCGDNSSGFQKVQAFSSRLRA